MKKGLVYLAGLLLMSSQPITAQEREAGRDAELPPWVAEDVIGFFNDPTTVQFSGRSRIPSTRIVVGNVGALGGPFTIAGEVDGDLVVVNGDLIFEEGGTVTGDVLIVGGRVLGEELGRVSGNLRVFDAPLRYVQQGDRIYPAGRRPGDEADRFSQRFPWGDARFVLKAGQNYNRGEGLPVIFGPSIRTGGSNPLRLDAWGVWRTEMGLELGWEDFGFLLKAEQALGGRDQIAFGATGFSYIDPIEDWGITNLEASLATFILHKDYRDYFEREGWSAYARFSLPYLPVELKAEFFQENHSFVPVAGPWSLTKNDQRWRSQPLIAEGEIRYLEESLIIDTRNRRNQPSNGWYVQATGRQGLGGQIIQPAHWASTDTDAELVPESEYDTDFITGFLDVRSYNRIGQNSFLNFRGLLGGALKDVPLPPQFQHAMGGAGSLPGYSLFSVDCGARSETMGYDVTDGAISVRDPVFPSYGCDQIALFQAEFRGSLFVDWNLGRGRNDDPFQGDWDWAPRVELSPAWAAFFDVGRGWAADGLTDTETVADVGLGLYLGDLGAFYAYPLNADASGGRNGYFFIRLSRRF